MKESALTIFLYFLDKILDYCRKSPNHTTNQTDDIGLNYMRLFGFLEFIHVLKAFQDREIIRQYNNETRYFLETWEYKDSEIFISEVLDWINKANVVDIVLKSLNEKLLEKYIDTSRIIYRSGLPFLSTSIPVSRNDVESIVGPFHEDDIYSLTPPLNALFSDQQGRFGLLTLILTNNCNVVLTNLVFQYVLILSAGKPSDFSMIKSMLTEQKLTKHLPYLKPGASFLWPSRVYLADKDNDFTGEVVSPWIVPISISYVLNGKRKTKLIRMPNAKTAIRVKIPLGWYYQ